MLIRKLVPVIATLVLLFRAPGGAQEPAPGSWLGDAGNFFQRPTRILANNPSGVAFTMTVHRHVWKAAGDWANGGNYALRILAPDGTEQAKGTIPSGDDAATLQVPAGAKGVYTLEIKPAGYGLAWVECSLPQLVAECPYWQDATAKDWIQLHVMTPRRWYFYVPAGTRRFQVRHVILTSQTHREDYGFLVMNPRGQRVEAFYGGKSLDMSPTSGSPRPGFTLPLAPVPITRTVEVDPGTDGRFWNLWITGGDSHNFSDLSLMFDGLPSYLASSPEQWFDPRTGLSAPKRVYDEAVIRTPDTVDAKGNVHDPYPRYFCTPSPFLGDEDYNGWRGAHTVWLLNPENRKIEFGVQTYTPSAEDQTNRVAIKVTGPKKDTLLEQALPLGKSVSLAEAGAGVYRVDCDSPRWFPWTFPAPPIVIQGQPTKDGGTRFALETGVARHWFFMVLPGTKQFKVAVEVRDPLHVLRVEVHAPDRLLDELAVRGGARRELVVPVPAQLAGRIWFIRTEIGSATRFVSSKGHPTQVNIEADIELQGVPGYLAPTWEQWFDPERPGK